MKKKEDRKKNKGLEEEEGERDEDEDEEKRKVGLGKRETNGDFNEKMERKGKNEEQEREGREEEMEEEGRSNEKRNARKEEGGEMLMAGEERFRVEDYEVFAVKIVEEE